MDLPKRADRPDEYDVASRTNNFNALAHSYSPRTSGVYSSTFKIMDAVYLVTLFKPFKLIYSTLRVVLKFIPVPLNFLLRSIVDPNAFSLDFKHLLSLISQGSNFLFLFLFFSLFLFSLDR